MGCMSWWTVLQVLQLQIALKSLKPNQSSAKNPGIQKKQKPSQSSNNSDHEAPNFVLLCRVRGAHLGEAEVSSARWGWQTLPRSQVPRCRGRSWLQRDSRDCSGTSPTCTERGSHAFLVTFGWSDWSGILKHWHSNCSNPSLPEWHWQWLFKELQKSEICQWKVVLHSQRILQSSFKWFKQ